MSEDVSPVVVVLDEVALGEARSETIADAGDIDQRDGEESGYAVYALHAHAGKGGFIQRAGAESVRLIHLNGPLVELVGEAKGGAHVGTVVAQGRPIEAPVQPLRPEVFIQPEVILQAVAIGGGAVIRCVHHRSAARKKESCSRTAGAGIKGVGGGLDFLVRNLAHW